MLETVFGHDNIIKLLATFLDDKGEYFWLVMEFAENRDLAELINEREKLNLEVTRAYAAQMILALEKLQDLKIAHRDIKP